MEPQRPQTRQIVAGSGVKFSIGNIDTVGRDTWLDKLTAARNKVEQNIQLVHGSN